MKDLQNILRRVRQLNAQHIPYVLATIVQVEGSAYRGPGTRILIESLQESTGSISGGCLEGDVRQRAVGLLADDSPQLLYYDYTGEEDFLWGTGLGCSGTIRVLLERGPTPGLTKKFDVLQTSAFDGEQVLLATVFSSEDSQRVGVGHYLSLDHVGTQTSDLKDEGLQKKIRRDLLEMSKREVRGQQTQAETHHYKDEGAAVLLEAVAPPISLTLFGAGHDAEPLVQIASTLGWHVELTDHRLPYARPERFPSAERVWLAPSGQWPEGLQLKPGSAALVMSHNYLQDQAMLRRLLPQPLAYLGLLGPRERSKRLLTELAQEGIVAADPQHLYAPLGLDLGGKTPEAIALSALAEIQAVLNERPAHSLRTEISRGRA